MKREEARDFLFWILFIIICFFYIKTEGSFMFKKIHIGDETLTYNEVQGNSVFSTGKKFGIGEKITGRYLDVTLQDVSVTSDISNLKVPGGEMDHVIDGRLQEGYKVIKLRFKVDSKSDVTEEIYFSDELKLRDKLKLKGANSYLVLQSEVNKELPNQPALIKFPPNESKDYYMAYIFPESEINKFYGSNATFNLYLPLEEKYKYDQGEKIVFKLEGDYVK